MQDIELYLDKLVNPIIEDLVYKVASERPEDPVSFMVRTLSNTGLNSLDNASNGQEFMKLESTRRELRISMGEFTVENERYYTNESVQETFEELEETVKWYYCSDKNLFSIKQEINTWLEYEDSYNIEEAYQQYLYARDYKLKETLAFSRYQIEGTSYVIDFINNIQISIKDNNVKNYIGRFKGNPNKNLALCNTLTFSKIRWFYKDNDVKSEVDWWVPYKIVENINIELNYQNYILSKGYPKYILDKNYEIDFEKLQEHSIKDGTNRKLGRFENCPNNVKRNDYFSNKIKPNIPITNMDEFIYEKDYYLTFKNIFPSKHYSKSQKFRFYYNADSNDLILHMISGLGSNFTEESKDNGSTKLLVDKILLEGYKTICEIRKDKEEFKFSRFHTIPINLVAKLFRTNWYLKLEEENNMLWLQYSEELNKLIEIAYRNKFLYLSDHGDIEIPEYNLKLNFSKNKQIKNGVFTSVMRFNIRNSHPENIVSLKVPYEINRLISFENEKLKKENKLVVFANKFGPKNFKELVNEVSNELRLEGKKMNFEEEAIAYIKYYVLNMTVSNFVQNIIKIYTEEGFVYRKINKILRENDYEDFFGMKYFYFSLLFSIEKYRTNWMSCTIYRGLKLDNDQINFYKHFKKGEILTFNDFFSTTYDRDLAICYAEKAKGSYLLEIEVPKEFSVCIIESISLFPSEKEVLLPSGTKFYLSELKETKDYTIMKLSLFTEKSNKFDHFLNCDDKLIDFSAVNFNLNELKNLFNFLVKNKSTRQIKLIVNDEKLIPYFAEEIALNHTLNFICLIKENKEGINQHFTYNNPHRCNLVLQGFSNYDFSLFTEYFFKYCTINSLSLPNYNEDSLVNLGRMIACKDSLISLDIGIIRNFSDKPFQFLTAPICYSSIMKELNLNGFFLTENSIPHIANLIEVNVSLEKISFSMENCSFVSVIAEKIRANKVLKEIVVSFNNTLLNKKSIKYGRKDNGEREITLINIHNCNFESFLSKVLYKNVNHLNLCNNKLNKTHDDLIVNILKENLSITKLDLSSNQLCDSFINSISKELKNRKFIKELNLENNQITEVGYKLLKDLQFQTNLSYNYIPNQNNQVTNTDLISDQLICNFTLSGHQNYVSSLLLLSNGYLASSSFDTTIRIWNPLNDFSCEHVLYGHKEAVLCLTELKEGLLCTGSYDKIIKLWDSKDNFNCCQTLKGHMDAVLSLLLLQNGNLVSASNDKTIRIWLPGEIYICTHILKGHLQGVYSIALCPDGNLASGSRDHTIRIWFMKDDYKCLKILEGHNGSVLSLTIISRGFLASGSSDKTIKIWDFNDNYKCKETINAHAGPVSAIKDISEDKFVSASFDSTLKIWDSKFTCVQTIQGHSDGILSLLCLPLGKLASSSNDNTIKIWGSKESIYCIHTVQKHFGSVICLVELKDGKIASGSGDKTIRIWNPLKQFTSVQKLIGHRGSVLCLLQQQDGDLASGSGDGSIRIWRLSENYKCTDILEGHTSYVYSLLSLADGTLLSASNDKSIRIWSPTDNYTCKRSLQGHTSYVYTLILSSDKKILSGSGDSTIRIWNPYENFTNELLLKGHSGSVLSLLLLPDGRIASGSADKTIRIWDPLNNFSCNVILKGHSGPILTMLILPDGNLISGSNDCTLKIWNPYHQNECIGSVLEHEGGIYSLLEMRNGKILSSSSDKTIRVWVR